MNKWALIGVAIVIAGVPPGAFAATPWEDFLRHPSPDRASRVQVLSYSSPTVETGQQEEDLMLLEVQVHSREPEAVRLAFRLRRGADGVVGEVLDIMLGRLIRIDPRLFLQEAMRAGADSLQLDSLVGNFGLEYVDKDEARNYESEQRIAALKAVTDGGLRALRDKCIATLRK